MRELQWIVSLSTAASTNPTYTHVWITFNNCGASYRQQRRARLKHTALAAQVRQEADAYIAALRNTKADE